jgi:hypothetical protein
MPGHAPAVALVSKHSSAGPLSNLRPFRLGERCQDGRKNRPMALRVLMVSVIEARSVFLEHGVQCSF